MAFAAGDIVEGTVASITPYGAFILLPDSKRGLIHISEIADEYVASVADFLKENQQVKVKVLAISSNGNKIDLSLRQANGDGKKPEARAERRNSIHVKPLGPVNNKIRKSDNPEHQEFEDKLASFLKKSEERLGDLKRSIESKQGVRKR